MRYDYDRGFRRGGALPPPSVGWLSGAHMGQAPLDGWGWWGGPWDWPPYPAIPGNRYDDFLMDRRLVDPRESGTYGRGGDMAARRWAERYGYDVEMTFRPRGRRHRSG
jgi:hypothetical protein